MAKAKSSRGGATVERVKTTIYLPLSAYQRLGAACLAQRKKRGEIIEMLINQHLARYVLSVRPERAGQSDVTADSDVQPNLPDSPAA
jgi:hypothetical protein